MKKYKAVFFDLDHTLWDFEKNSQEAISELFNLHKLHLLGIPGEEAFITTYRKINHQMWSDYHQNKISKEKLREGRFRQALGAWGVQDIELAELLSSQYLKNCPVKAHLFPGALEILKYLSETLFSGLK